MDSDETESEPADKAHLHRPMNAFLLFCKQHRPVVRERHPSIENRAVTKILGEWWSNLEEEDKSPYTSLAHQYKEAFMKANPEFRWHKMPPGTADSVPPSNIKPSTPSPANGMVCSPVNGLLSTSNSNFPPSELATSQDASSSPNSSASAPKPFKKRYLASQQSTNSQEPPISPASSLSSAGVSPEQARACEALMELARNESCASRSSEGSERRASPSDTPPMQTLREAVWSKVAGTLLKQVSIFLWRLWDIIMVERSLQKRVDNLTGMMAGNFMILQEADWQLKPLCAASLTHVQPFGFMQSCYTADFSPPTGCFFHWASP